MLNIACTLLLAGGTAPSYLDHSGYATRQLASGYTGPILRVERSSDNTQQDIGNDGGGNLDVAAMLAFVGTGATDQGYVVTWYDQSGDGNHLTLATTIADAPRIVIDGQVVNLGGYPALYAEEGTKLKSPDMEQKSMVLVMRSTDENGISNNYGADSNLTNYGISWENGNTSTTLMNSGAGTPAVRVDDVVMVNRDDVYEAIRTAEPHIMTATGYTRLAGAGGGVFTLFFYNFGSISATAFISELRLYDVDQASNITTIVSTLQGIYSGSTDPLPDTGLNWFSTATTTSSARYVVTRDEDNGEWVFIDGASPANAWRSTDGIAWTSSSIGAASIQDIKYINPTIGTIAVGRKFNGVGFDAKIYRSTGGAWSEVYSLDVSSGDGAVSVATDGTRVYVGIEHSTINTSRIVSSTDGTTWGDEVTGLNTILPRYAAYNGSRVVFITSPSTAHYTDNGGVSWSSSATSGININLIAFGEYMEGANGVFLAGDGTNLYRSTNGLGWSTVDTANAYGFAYSSTLDRWIVATEEAGQYMKYSDDGGSTWTNATTQPTQSMRDVAWAGDLNQFLVVSQTANSSGVWVSPDN